MTVASALDIFPADRDFITPETYDAFFAMIERLEAAVVGETKALAENRHADLGTFTWQKRQGFLELNRIMRAMENTIPSEDIITRLAAFRKTLEANDVVLSTHLRAVSEVTEIIVRVMREAESDGTYSRAYGRADHGYP